jgi:hypothetical protein
VVVVAKDHAKCGPALLSIAYSRDEAFFQKLQAVLYSLPRAPIHHPGRHGPAAAHPGVMYGLAYFLFFLFFHFLFFIFLFVFAVFLFLFFFKI